MIVLRVAGNYDICIKSCPDEPPENAAENVIAACQFGIYFPPKPGLMNSWKMFESLKLLRSKIGGIPYTAANKPQENPNFNMHCVGKTMSDLHALLIDYENGLKDKAPTPQGFKEERKLSYGDQYLQVGNGTQAAVEAIGMFDLVLPSGLVLKLNNCYYAPSIVRGVVSLSYLLGLIHTDVCGPLRHVSRKGASYFLTFTDDFSRYGYVYLLKHKHEVFETFKVFKAEVELQLGKKIKALRSDKGGEYLSQEFKDYLSENGIVQNLTSPYTPQQNGVSERRNRTLLDMVRSMFNLTTLPLSFWDYALESAVRILNMVPTKKVDKTPYEIWHGKAPNLSYLKVWGCEAYVKRDSADKLQQRSVKCIFVGYPKETMGYYFYFPPENKVIVARYGDFLERDLISQEFSGRDYDLEDDHMDTLPSENTSEIPVEPESLGPPSELIPVRRSERTKRAPNRLCLNMEVEDDVVGDLGEPANYKTAMLDPDKVIWQGAMDEEMNSMKVNEVWTEVDPPPNAKIVRSKWIFKKKTDMDGKVHTYKARLVAKGCTQTYGVDYEETFSPVADIRAIRILIAIAAYYDYEIWQMDVKTAFLNGRLDEDIYMEQPEGYVNPKYPNRVCKLQRSIYGLKQASRQWNKRFDEEIKRFGFTQNRDEPCVYRKASGSNVVFLILYVDDILIMGNNIPRLKEVKDYLGKCFSMKDLGEAAYILGIKIYRDRSLRLIGLNQSAYIDKILKKFSMQNSKKGFIPMEVKHDLSNEMCASSDEEKAYMKKVPYASAVGSIMYAVRCTRPDVAFAQNLVSRYQQNPGKLHWVAVKHILKYLRNTKDMFLVYGGNPDTELEVTGFCDASWQCDKDDTKSQTGYVFVVNGGAVDWKSKKQTTIAMHATQSEYMAASEAAMEAVWIRKFVGDLGVMPSINKPINMYCDNSAAITFANEPGVMKGARHFLRRYHYVREQVESGEIKLIKVHTDKNLADAFTKALPRGKVNEHANGIGLRLASSFMHILFSVHEVWEAIRPRGTTDDWTSIVWFLHCVPRHAFFGLAYYDEKTKDTLRRWDVWSMVMDGIGPVWEDIVSWIKPMATRRTFVSIVARLVIAATVYFVWQEQNFRLIKNQARTPMQQIHDIIVYNVRLKLLTFRFRKKQRVVKLLEAWNVSVKDYNRELILT
ncbi:putative RNA-directed DNA polymerase [Tanacetum coccineum]